ncbi:MULTISPECIES: response regulator transcription factor [unclassified Rhodococcus (in: high G+C Gram-positive bacteria)]|uniref:response regulator transcription factor n=1 Tax=unclassified Rhodococcus (in: high G+C Gram-positive bacteria) TaxID=192944 RepID=UPI000B9A8AE7|nr:MULTISPECIES: response regulator transcription factor [unclassified Rhodococcus (in: high G+C Gram-positive bacteria)]OZE33445.1 DNA-binding response regulator [Rhodococcus sp. 05-2254-4]OZE44384.1 DNA-binding response regulator [Rhodococcus sp. 05-2254-3]OZE56663.1 DNA-binding response regulator [Rhodococcus sp. 05-2254-2]
MITVLIADDQPVVRQGFELFLAGHPDIEVVGHASSGKHAVQQVSTLKPDVVLMDIRMPNGDGLTATREILAQFDNVRVIVVTTFDLDEYVFAALDAGASGFLLKDTDPDELADAVVTVACGGAVLSPRLTPRLMTEFARRGAPSRTTPVAPQHDLSLREMEVVQLLAQGLGNNEIARELQLEQSTVKTHIGNICRKLDVKTRVHVVIWAYRNGLVSS